jgi:hypothetical protein
MLNHKNFSRVAIPEKPIHSGDFGTDLFGSSRHRLQDLGIPGLTNSQIWQKLYRFQTATKKIFG